MTSSDADMKIRVGDWIKFYNLPSLKYEIGEVTGLDCQDGAYIECGYFIHSDHILEIRRPTRR